MTIIRDKKVWHAAWLDTPFRTPPAGLTHNQALMTPGCFVKTIKRVDNWPEMLGRLVSVVGDVVTVRSNEPYHDKTGTPFVWIGSVAEYTTTWRCD